MPNELGADDLNGQDDSKLDINTIDPETATPEQVEELKKTAQSALIQRAKFREQAIDPETKKPYKDLLAEVQAKKPEIDKPDPPATDDIAGLKKEVDTLKLSDQKRHIGYRHKLSPEETDLLMQMSGNDPSKADETVKSEFFQAGLQGLRAKRGVESNTPNPSNRSPQVEGKTFGQMTEKERKENFDKVKAGLAKK